MVLRVDSICEMNFSVVSMLVLNGEKSGKVSLKPVSAKKGDILVDWLGWELKVNLARGRMFSQ